MNAETPGVEEPADTYFVADPVLVAAAGAAADAVAGVVASVLVASVLAAPAEASPPVAPSPVWAVAGLAEEYRSLYQPAPLNWIAGAVSVRSSGPPQCGHTVNSASENFCIFSVRR